MPIRFYISKELNLTYARWSGAVDMAQFREMYASYVCDQNYVMGRPELCDFSQVTGMDVGFQQVWSVLSLVNTTERPLSQKTRCVVLAPGDTAFGLARMYQSLAEFEGGIEVIVCREEAEALAAAGFDDVSISALMNRGSFHEPAPNCGILS